MRGAMRSLTFTDTAMTYRSENSLARTLRSPLTWVIVALIGIAAAFAWWQFDLMQKRERLEQERVAEEAQERHRTDELEARRRKEQERFKEDIAAQKEIEDKQRAMDAEFRKDELTRKRFTSDDRQVASPGYAGVYIQDEIRRREGESRQHYEGNTRAIAGVFA